MRMSIGDIQMHLLNQTFFLCKYSSPTSLPTSPSFNFLSSPPILSSPPFYIPILHIRLYLSNPPLLHIHLQICNPPLLYLHLYLFIPPTLHLLPPLHRLYLSNPTPSSLHFQSSSSSSLPFYYYYYYYYCKTKTDFQLYKAELLGLHHLKYDL